MGLCPPSESSRSQRPPCSSRSEDRDSSRRLPPMRSLPLQRIPTRSSSMLVRLASPHRLRPQVFATSRRLHPPRVCWPCFMPDPLMGLHPPEPSSSRAAVRRLRRRYPPDVEGARIGFPAATAPTAETVNTTVHRVTLHVETIRVSRFSPYAPHRRDGTQRPSYATLRAAEATRHAQHRPHPPNDRSHPARPERARPKRRCRSSTAARASPARQRLPKQPPTTRIAHTHRTTEVILRALARPDIPDAEAPETNGLTSQTPDTEASDIRHALQEGPGRRDGQHPASCSPRSPERRSEPGPDNAPGRSRPPKRPEPRELAPRIACAEAQALRRALAGWPHAAEATCDLELTRPTNAPSEKTASAERPAEKAPRTSSPSRCYSTREAVTAQQVV
jgi:hypothetical protein